MRHPISAVPPADQIQSCGAAPAAAVAPPSDFSCPAPVALPGSRGRRSSAGGPLARGARPGPSDAAARGCSTFSIAAQASPRPHNREEMS